MPNFFSRLFNTKKYQQSQSDTVERLIKEMAPSIIAEAYELYIKELASEEVSRKLKLEAENAERITAHMTSNEPWFEAKDIDGDMSDVSNFRWNQAFIDRFNIENGYRGISAKESFKKFLEKRDLERIKEIIQAERDKHYDSPDPWFEWTLHGRNDRARLSSSYGMESSIH